MQVSKWGNSLAIRLPKKLVEELDLKSGDSLRVVEAKDKTIKVAKAAQLQVILKELDKFRLDLPEDYAFDREEANKR